MAERDDDLDALTDLLGAPALDADEQAAVLDLARVVAHSSQRRFAPLSTYALGLALGGATDPAERTRRLRAAIQAVEANP